MRIEWVLETFSHYIDKSSDVSAALDMCMVAQGGADVYYEFGPHAWDMAAADLIGKNNSISSLFKLSINSLCAVREAGGVTIDPSGGALDIMSRRVLAASSKELADDFSRLLTQYYPAPRDD